MRLAVIAISLAVLAAGLTLRPTHNGAEDRVCEHPTSSDVRALYQTWETALRAGDVEALTALYSPDAILMGPGASSIRLGRSEIAAYYTVFVRHAPAARVIERVVRTDCGAANDIGLETVTFGPATDERGTPARYSLSYALSGQRWLIVHHHQEMLEPVADDGRVADTASARIVTGTNPTTASPSAPPADANRRMQFVLPLPRNPEPPPPIDFAALDRLLALAPPAEVTLPEPAFAVATEAPRIEPVPARVISAPIPRTVTVDIPAPPFTLAVAPPAIIATEAEPERTPEVAMDPSFAPPPSTAPSARPKPTAIPSVAPVKTLPKPAVAGFTQRVPAPPQPTVQVAARPSAAPPRPPDNATKPLPVQATTVKDPAPRAGRFLRWDESTPIFDE